MALKHRQRREFFLEAIMELDRDHGLGGRERWGRERGEAEYE